MEEKCPHCSVTILLGFVKINGYCPSCGKPLAIEPTITGPQLCIPEAAPTATVTVSDQQRRSGPACKP